MALNLRCGPVAGEQFWCQRGLKIDSFMFHTRWHWIWDVGQLLVNSFDVREAWKLIVLCFTPDDIEFEMWASSWWTGLMLDGGEHVWCQAGMEIDHIYVWHQMTLNLKCGPVAGEHVWCHLSDAGEHVWCQMLVNVFHVKWAPKNDV